MKREEILEQIESHKRDIEQYWVKKLALVGSYARREAEETSDVDFVVEFKKGRGLFDDYIGLLHFLEDLLKSDVDLIKRGLVREELKPSILGGEKIEATV